jgi:hypothetical protein
MKKYLLLFLTLTGVTLSYAQELVVGGELEGKGSWQTASPMGGADEATFEFGYQNDAPALGENGCLAITGLGQTRCLAWQEVTITPGHYYVLSGVFKNSSLDAVLNTWMEVLLSRIAPDPTKDYGAGKGDYIYANNTWMTAPYGDFTDLDGKLIELAQFTWKAGSSAATDTTLTAETIYMPDTVTVTKWYLGLKAGIWNDVAGEPTFVYLFDKISLVDLGETPNSIHSANTESNRLGMVYPSPSNGLVTIKANGNNKGLNYTLYNHLGSMIHSGIMDSETLNLNLSAMAKGVYYIKITSFSKSETHKLILR